MYTLFVTLILVAAVLMVIIVLIQESKGGGLASGFSGVNSIAGVRSTTQFVEKATWGLAVAMVVLSIACAYVAPEADTAGSVIENAATEQAATNPNNVQGFGAAQQKDAAAPAAAEKPAAETPAEAPAEAPANK